jgi:hypothetical protein
MFRRVQLAAVLGRRHRQGRPFKLDHVDHAGGVPARAMDNNPRVKAGKKGSVPALGILAPNIFTLYSVLEHALVVFLTWRITFHQGRLRARYLEWSRLLSLETTMF